MFDGKLSTQLQQLTAQLNGIDAQWMQDWRNLRAENQNLRDQLQTANSRLDALSALYETQHTHIATLEIDYDRDRGRVMQLQSSMERFMREFQLLLLELALKPKYTDAVPERTVTTIVPASPGKVELVPLTVREKREVELLKEQTGTDPLPVVKQPDSAKQRQFGGPHED